MKGGRYMMLKKTPLRLVAFEEQAPTEEEKKAAPVAMMTEAEAITRKVPNADAIAAREAFAEKPKGMFTREKILPAGIALAIVSSVAIIALATTGKKATPPKNAAPPTMVTAQPVAAQPAPLVGQPAAVLETAPAPAPRAAVAPEIIRLEITADPVEAELSLDGNVLAGHRLSLQVPKDRGIHVVSASAPGYVPFNQQVSFSGDVILNINLRRGHAAAARPAPARARTAPVEVRAKAETRSAAGQPAARLEPGMSLEGPPVRSTAKPIDERNPYKP
jgi:hypothetical protein